MQIPAGNPDMAVQSPLASDRPVTLEPRPFRVRLPGFLASDASRHHVQNVDIGLGDVIKRVTFSLGVKPCGGCDKRAAVLNRRVVFMR
jgi:hypothetical protein